MWLPIDFLLPPLKSSPPETPHLSSTSCPLLTLKILFIFLRAKFSSHSLCLLCSVNQKHDTEFMPAPWWSLVPTPERIITVSIRKNKALPRGKFYWLRKYVLSTLVFILQRLIQWRALQEAFPDSSKQIEYLSSKPLYGGLNNIPCKIILRIFTV